MYAYRNNSGLFSRFCLIISNPINVTEKVYWARSLSLFSTTFVRNNFSRIHISELRAICFRDALINVFIFYTTFPRCYCLILTKAGICRQILIKTMSNVIKICQSVLKLLHTDRRTDGQAHIWTNMAKLIGEFLQLFVASSPKNRALRWSSCLPTSDNLFSRQRQFGEVIMSSGRIFVVLRKIELSKKIDEMSYMKNKSH
jgi:hypothetical protein